MSDGPQETGERLRSVAEEGRRDPLGITAGSVVARGRRMPGSPVARRHRLVLWGSNLRAHLAGVGQRPGRSARRAVALGFVAALVALATVGLVGSRNAGHGLAASNASSGPTTSQPSGPTGPTGGGSSTTTTSTVPSVTTLPPTTTPSTTVLPPTTTTIPAPQGITGYQEVQQTNTTTCTSQPSSSPCASGGELNGSSTASCPSGTKALGGGGQATEAQDGLVSDGTTGSASVIASYPAPGGSGWTVVGSTPYQGLSVTAYALCADVAS